jgi:cell division protein FtsB
MYHVAQLKPQTVGFDRTTHGAGVWMMKNRERRLPLPPTDIMTVLVATAVVFFGLALGGKALEDHRLQRHNTTLRMEIAALEERREQLEAHATYVQSPEYVEQVAREQYKWTKPDEKLVIPILQRRPAMAVTPTPAQSANEPGAAQPASQWPQWWGLLTGSFD